MKNSNIVIMYLYIKDNRKTIIANILFVLIFIVVFTLYGLELEPLVYAFFLSVSVAIIFIGYNFINYYKKHKVLCKFKNQIDVGIQNMPMTSNLIEKDYQDNLLALYEQMIHMTSRIDSKQTDMIDYYTLWAHQIKTPVAAMRLLLQGEGMYNEHNKELLAQIFAIEQYIEMVLSYLKIETSSTDLVLEKYKLSEIVKQCIRKYANLFIKKDVKLVFKEMNSVVLTDEKWLAFAIEQLLSNALKYTTDGYISIYMDDIEQHTLVIEDTGIGIASGDVPRVFEKGYTGYNGRLDKKATGIGLYLCKRILDKLSHRITISSEINVGTKVMINLSAYKIDIT